MTAPRPVDGHYQLTPRTRRFLARRSRLHNFHLLAPESSARARATVKAIVPSLHGDWHTLVLDRPVRLLRGQTLDVVTVRAGWLAGHAAGGELSVRGEALPKAAGRSLAPALFGALTLTARRATVVRTLTALAARPALHHTVDRYPVHLELWPGESLVVPLHPARRARLVSQLSVHWGSVEYARPERRLPLGAWGYPYYVDGVLGDIGGDGPEGACVLARGKFLELDEVENAHSFRPRPLHHVTVRLRSRDGVWPSRPCRIAAVEVRYADRGPPALELAPGAQVRVRRPVHIELPHRFRVDRVDVLWRDDGPAMGALGIGNARTAFVNVCSGERRAFCLPERPPVSSLTLHAALAPYDVERLWLYGSAA